MNRWKKTLLALATLAALLVMAQNKPLDPFEEAQKQRQQFKDTFGVLPGELYSANGEELYFKKRGPKNVTLEGCDFGLGAGVLEGAYARLPRYFADTRQVEDLDTRIRTCMLRLQGFKPDQIVREDVLALAAFVASKSSKMPIHVELKTGAEAQLYNLGKELWYYRAGVRDMNCATCHDSKAGARIRLSPLKSPKQGLSDEWPAYRFEVDKLYTLEDRIQFCYSSIAVSPPAHYSEPVIALSLYMRYQANGKLLTELPGFTR